jgi:hypothetical protein
MVYNNEHTLAYPTRRLFPRARETEKASKASKALALIDEAVFGDVKN